MTPAVTPHAPEVLAPVGSPEALQAAVRCGADAVYLGASAFNARQHAQNFDTAALREAVSYCHARGVAVHLTLNTLVRQAELPQALELAATACALGIDALIVQDVGLARRIHAAAPDMPLHASTQLSCHSPAGVRFLRDNGFSRVVLSREMTREEIRACTGLGCELEVFVHGALCMCVSGQCYFSAMLGGRSGNRGLCAQPCRLPFAVADDRRAAPPDEAALSLRDAALWEHVQELAAMGIASFKIEGRMKRPEYVAAATAVYRAAVNGQPLDEQRLRDLRSVFSRTGFTDGYYADRRGHAMFGVRRKEDVVAAEPILGRLAQLYAQEAPRVPVTLMLEADTQRTRLTAADGDGHAVVVDGTAAEPALHRPLDAERAQAQLRKTGGTPFCATEAVCHLAAGVTLPLSQINAMRRDSLQQLEQARGAIRAIPFDPAAVPAPPPCTEPQPTPLLVARIAQAAQLPAAAAADRVIVPLTLPVTDWQSYAGGGLGVDIPRGLFGAEDTVRRLLANAAQAGATFALCGNVGAIPLAQEAGLRPVGGFGLNITNAEALAFFAEAGLEAATLSMELTFRQMEMAATHPIPTGCLVYGRQPLMLCRNCPGRSSAGCASCDGRPALVDRKGLRFPLVCGKAGCAEVLNSAVLYWADQLAALPRLDFWLLHFTDESPAQVAAVLQAHRTGGEPPAAFTRGLYRRGVE